MCELFPQWVHTTDLTRDGVGDANDYGSQTEVGKTIDKFDKCHHTTIARLDSGYFYCHRCQRELKLILK